MNSIVIWNARRIPAETITYFHETGFANWHQGAGQPEGLRGTSRRQCCRPPGHGRLQIDGPVRAASIRDLDL